MKKSILVGLVLAVKLFTCWTLSGEVKMNTEVKPAAQMMGCGGDMCRLSICDMTQWVHLGSLEGMSDNPQCVTFNIFLDFSKLPEGAKTDELTDTCYCKQLIEKLQADFKTRSFKLIECVAYFAHQSISQSLIDMGCHNIEKVTVEALFSYCGVQNVHRGLMFTYAAAPKVESNMVIPAAKAATK